jgi:hypothetical protein
MKVKARFLAAVSAVAIVTPGLGAPVAHADPPLPIPTVSDVINVAGCADVNPPLQTVGGGGTFQKGDCNPPFDALTFCEVTSDPGLLDTPPAVELVPVRCDFSSTFGTYDNIVCGTGQAHGGNVSITGPESFSGPFDILFAGGEGVFVSNHITEDPGTPGAYEADGYGTVSILPSGGNCVAGVTQFYFAANIVVVDRPNSP